jgi:hypothetical protein
LGWPVLLSVWGPRCRFCHPPACGRLASVFAHGFLIWVPLGLVAAEALWALSPADAARRVWRLRPARGSQGVPDAMRGARAESLALHFAVLRSTWVARTATVLASPLSMALLSVRRAWARQGEAAVMGVPRPADRVRLVLARGSVRV